MSRSRVTYQTQALYTGPAPSTGLHFMDIYGTYSNDIAKMATGSPELCNLVQQLNRVNTFSFEFEAARTNVQKLGRQALVDQPAIEPPSINLSFTWMASNMRNEARLGFKTNFPKFYAPFSGQPFYTDNFSVNVLEGFSNQVRNHHAKAATINEDLEYPRKYQDQRNLFLNVMPEGRDAKDSSPTGTPSQNVNTFVFTDCFITSYTAAAQVGNVPTVNVSYTAENVQYQTDGSGIVPCLDPRTREPKNDIAFLLPEMSGENMPNVLTPGDVSVEILSTGYGPSTDDIKDVGLKFSDMKLQSYNLRMDFEREPLRSLGFKGLIDRPVNFPTFATLGFQTIVGEMETGSLIALLNKDHTYDITIRLKDSRRVCTNLPVLPEEATAIRYDLKGARFQGISWEESISQPFTANLNYSCEINPEDAPHGKGVYFSGVVMDSQDNPVGGLLMNQSGTDELITESGDGIILFYKIPPF
jgi:hypothetical protein